MTNQKSQSEGKGIKVLSLFDGISCARVALDRLGIKIDKYYASEIDKYAIQIALKNYPDTIEVGDITQLKDSDFKDIDLLIGGSPCQDLSIAGKRKGLNGERSGLFWEYARLLNEIKPKYFVLENVNSMPKEAKQIITGTLGVQPIMIDASLVSAQSRKRLFWTNIPNVIQPEDKGILLKDILEEGIVDRDKSYCIDASYYKGANWKQYKEKGRRQLKKVGFIGKDSMGSRVYSTNGLSKTLSANGGGWGAKTGLYLIAPNGKQIILGDEKIQVLKEGRTELGKKTRQEIKKLTGKDSTFRGREYKAYFGREGTKSNCLTTGLGIEGTVVENFVIRKLTPIECERLMTLPDNYTEGVSNTQRYKCLGNGFVVDVIVNLLQSFTKQSKENKE